jgi:hypothetical protein
VSRAETSGTAIGSDITTNSDGDVFAVWPDTGSQKLYFVKSTDGGATFSAPLAIAKTFGSFQIHVPAFAERGALIGVSIAAFKKNVYASWVDLSGEPGCDSVTSEPGDDVDSPCKSRVWFAWSEDKGATWSTHPPIKISDSSDKSDQFNQKLAVDPSSGMLGIVYYQTGVGALRKKTNLVFQVWDTNASHWIVPATKVAGDPSDETTGTADLGNQYGDYNGLSIANGLFFPSWTDRRDNLAEAIFTAPITVTRTATGALVPALAKMDGQLIPKPAGTP